MYPAAEDCDDIAGGCTEDCSPGNDTPSLSLDSGLKGQLERGRLCTNI